MPKFGHLGLKWDPKIENKIWGQFRHWREQILSDSGGSTVLPHGFKRLASRKEHTIRFEKVADILYWKAAHAREQGLHYRNPDPFQVGCAVLAFQPYTNHLRVDESQWRIFVGMNAKVALENRPTCAEVIAIQSAYASGYTDIVGMVVVGIPRAEDTTPTLHPCEHCRPFMAKHPMLKPWVRIITALPPTEEIRKSGEPAEGEWEVHTLRELLRAHEEKLGDS